MKENMIKERIDALRGMMKTAGVHYYLITTDDPHGSEYINDYYKEREYFSGFTGSNGDLLVGEKECLLWTDGRYFVQAEKELAGSGIRLMKSGQIGVPTVEEYLREHIENGVRLGFYGFCMSAARGKKLDKLMQEKCGEVLYSDDLAGCVFLERPADSAAPVRVLVEELTGESYLQKLERVRGEMDKQSADALLLTKLEDQMWLFNIRGADIACNPVAYAYTLILKDKVYLYLKEAVLDDKVSDYFKENGTELLIYENFAEDLPQRLQQLKERLSRKGKVMADPEVISYSVCRMVSDEAELLGGQNPTEKMKAVKNPVEIENLKKVYLADSLALTRFIRFIKEHRNDGLRECEAADILDGYRHEIDGFTDLSFPTISAYGPNAAMMHYEAVPGKDAVIRPEGIYLVDSGGQYDGGTTDVTRSIIMGDITEEMKRHFTLAAMGMLRLQNAVFLHGCTGRNLDILARGPIWQQEMDYKCGTGHGVGYMLSVHEGPQNISWKSRNLSREAVLEEGMLVSDEPGVYIAGSHGIRTENILLCEKRGCNEDGQFMGFVPLTLVPIDLEGIDSSLMEPGDVERLNSYHRLVYESLAEYMSDEEKEWLRNQTKPVYIF